MWGPPKILSLHSWEEMVGDITLCFLFHFYPRCSKGVQYGREYLWCIKKIIVLLSSLFILKFSYIKHYIKSHQFLTSFTRLTLICTHLFLSLHFILTTKHTLLWRSFVSYTTYFKPKDLSLSLSKIFDAWLYRNGAIWFDICNVNYFNPVQ